MNVLRVIDAGSVSALRSQALWHGIADAMDPEAAPTLSFCRPAEPYVGIGYHRRLDEIDLESCRALGLPVIRRQIGGGPVYLDADQLFFQITLPAARAPASVDRLYQELLAPAVEAFRALGVDARLDGLNDIVVGDQKVSGTGAGRIGAAVTVVGNVIFRFPHDRMAQVLALPSEAMRGVCLDLMRRHVASLEDLGCGASCAQATAALRAAYGQAFGGVVAAGKLRRPETVAIERWKRRLADATWTAGPDLPVRAEREVKVRDGVFVVGDGAGNVRVAREAA